MRWRPESIARSHSPPENRGTEACGVPYPIVGPIADDLRELSRHVDVVAHSQDLADLGVRSRHRCGEGRVERTGNRVDHRQANTWGAVNGGELATDDQLAVRRDLYLVDDLVDRWPEGRDPVASVAVERRDVWLRLYRGGRDATSLLHPGEGSCHVDTVGRLGEIPYMRLRCRT